MLFKIKEILTLSRKETNLFRPFSHLYLLVGLVTPYSGIYFMTDIKKIVLSIKKQRATKGCDANSHIPTYNEMIYYS